MLTRRRTTVSASNFPPARRARLVPVPLEPAQITHHPLAVVVQVRDAVLTSDVEPTADLRVILDQAVQTHEGNAGRELIFGMVCRVEFLRVGSVLEQNREPGVSRPQRLDGKQGGPYFKLAHSLREAVEDLVANPGVADEGGYVVRDAFLEVDEDGDPVVHVELLSMRAISELLNDETSP